MIAPTIRIALVVCLSLLSWPMPVSVSSLAQAADGGRPKVITIDPGHGGHDFGVEGPAGVKEKNVTMAAALALKKLLGSDYSVRLTRDGDYFVDVEKRPAIANSYQTDLFVSLHVGSDFDHTARGVTIFYASEGRSPQPSEPLEENEGALRPWHQLYRAHIKNSKRLAELVHRRMFPQRNPVDRGIHKAPLLVLQGVDAPAILIELGYLSNPAEEKNLEEQKSLATMVQRISQGIRTYCVETDSCNTVQGVIEEDI